MHRPYRLPDLETKSLLSSLSPKQRVLAHFSEDPLFRRNSDGPLSRTSGLELGLGLVGV